LGPETLHVEGSDNATAQVLRSGWTRLRIRAAIALLLVTPAGFLTKFALPAWLGGAAGRWCNLYGAAVLYEVFWVLVLAVLSPRLGPRRSATGVFLATCVLEFLQRWHAPWLDDLRRTFLGAALLGNGFDWLDFPHYALGSALGGALAWRLRRETPRRTEYAR